MADRVFHSLEAFAHFVERQAVIAEVAPTIAAEYAQYILHKHITDAFGDATALRDLMPSTQAERARLGFTPNDPLVRTGELRDSVEHEAIGPVAAVGTADPRMVWLEFGTAHIAPLPAFEVGLRNAEPDIADIVDDIVGVTLGLSAFRARTVLNP